METNEALKREMLGQAEKVIEGLLSQLEQAKEGDLRLVPTIGKPQLRRDVYQFTE